MNTVFTDPKLRNNYVWNNIKLQVPKEIIIVNKKGKISMKDPLTKTNKISKFEKKPSIIIERSKDSKIHFIGDSIGDTSIKFKKDIYDKFLSNNKKVINEMNNIVEELKDIKEKNHYYKNNVGNVKNIKKKEDWKKLINEYTNKENLLEEKLKQLAQNNNILYKGYNNGKYWTYDQRLTNPIDISIGKGYQPGNTLYLEDFVKQDKKAYLPSFLKK